MRENLDLQERVEQLERQLNGEAALEPDAQV